MKALRMLCCCAAAAAAAAAAATAAATAASGGRLNRALTIELRIETNNRAIAMSTFSVAFSSEKARAEISLRINT